MRFDLSFRAALALCPLAAMAHVTLPPGGATAGTDYPAAFRVGHPCQGAEATTAIRVRFPAGFTPIEALPRAGWKLTLSAGDATWTAERPEAALRGKERALFTVRGRLPASPTTLWFKVLQVCDQGSADWAEVPANEGDAPRMPAARLDVLAPGIAPVDVREAWVRSTVPGQVSTAVFGKLTAGTGGRLVGASSPWAEAVEIHEMKMDGAVMRMRELPNGLDLPPGDTVELRSGGIHLMVLGLRRPVANDEEMPLVLRFVDREGRPSERRTSVRVRAGGSSDASHPHGR